MNCEKCGRKNVPDNYATENGCRWCDLALAIKERDEGLKVCHK